MARDTRLGAAQLAGVEVDPELVMMVIMDIAETQTKRGIRDLDLPTACAAAYFRFMGLDDASAEAEVLEGVHLPEIGALVMRVAALSKITAGEHLKRLMSPPTEEGLEVVAEAACAATLLEQDGEPAFQLLDFLGHLERAERDRRA